MKALKIGRLRIVNFKSIVDLDQRFDRDLMIFDGPNGFGKTTLFDALELAMYGSIKRIGDYKIIDQKQGYRDSLYFNDPSHDVLIQVQFFSEQSAFVVTKRLPSRKDKKKNGPVAINSPTAWGQFETYITDDFGDQFHTLKPCTQEQVYERLGVAHLMRAFHLFYYIQQEEKTHFIRSTEKERLQVLSDLFDTKREEGERKQLEDVRKTIAKRLDSLKKEIDQLRAPEHSIQTGHPSTEQVILYSPLILQGSQPLWDQELHSVTAELRQKSHDELDLIKDLVVHVQAFDAATFNKTLSNYLDNQKLLQATVILFAHLSLNPTQLREKEQRQREYQQWFNRLTRERLFDEIDQNGVYEALSEIVDAQKWPIDNGALHDLIGQIRRQRKNSSELSDIVVQINETRDALLTKHKRFLAEVTDASNSECPMCGHDWESVDVLSEQLVSKRQVFERHYTDSALAVTQLVDELFTNHISSIRASIQEYLTHSDHVVDASFFKEWEMHVKLQPQVQAFSDWCDAREYNLTPYVNNQMTGVGQQQLDTMVVNLREFLRSHMLPIEAGYQHTSGKFKEFEHITRTFFANDSAQIQQLRVEQLDQKRAYIDQIYYRTNAEEQAAKQVKLKQRLSEQDRLLEYEGQISTIINTYDSAIREHWAKIISDIEVIFYLYFAKVTQYYQRGLGMFIQQQRESDKNQGMAKALRFVYHADSDQDAINYLSSGQLSALVIALTLALNRVYNRGLGVLLIDDPVQTMDDINMASLTELLRNDFRDMQIIVSTHEDQAARYLKYKFLKYGLDAERINMKEKSLQLE